MQIIVLKNSSQAPRSFETCHAITFEELIQEFKTGRIIKRLFRYRDAELLTARNDAVVHPFATAFMLRVLSHRYCRFRDERNQCLSITWMALLRLFFRLLRDALFKYPFLARIKREIRFLSNEYDTRRSPQSLDRTHRLLYLRSDLLFGLRAGGSVGHIAGVLNEFHRQGLNPLLCTIDRIPMVDSAVSTHFLPPGRAFWDYLELPSLQFNDGIEKTIDDIFGGERPSFIYQRYSVNNFSGVKLAKRFEVPFVLEYNGSEVWMSRHWGTPFKYERISASIEDLNLKAADLIVVVSRIMKEELLKQGIDENRILVNPNGVDPSAYSPKLDGIPIRERSGFLDKTVIGFIGTFGRWHGAEWLVEAFADLLDENPAYRKNVRLLLIGDGMTMPSVRSIVANRQLDDVCVLTGLVSQREGPRYLAACDIAVSPQIPNPDGSPFFGSPTKLFEYMAMGKAVVASRLETIGEIVEHGRTGWLVEPGDSASLIDGLKTLIDDPPLRDRLGENAREEAIQHYTWEIHVGKIVDALERIGQ